MCVSCGETKSYVQLSCYSLSLSFTHTVCNAPFNLVIQERQETWSDDEITKRVDEFESGLAARQHSGNNQDEDELDVINESVGPDADEEDESEGFVSDTDVTVENP